MYTSMWQVYDWPDGFIAQGCCPIVSFYTLNAKMSKICTAFFFFVWVAHRVFEVVICANNIEITKYFMNLYGWLFGLAMLIEIYFLIYYIIRNVWVTCDYDFVEILLNQGYILQDIGNLR